MTKRGYFSAVRHDGVGNSDISALFSGSASLKKKPRWVVAKTEPAKEKQVGDEFADAMVSLQKDLGFASQLIGKVIKRDNARG